MCAGWKYGAASVIGKSHQASQEPVCQDAHATQYVEHASAFVGIISDGAGSASKSQLGSKRACDFVMCRINEAPASLLFERDFAASTLGDLRGDLQLLATDLGVALRELACTLLVAIVCPHRAIFWQIGDGAMCFRQPQDDKFQYAFWPEKGEYANVTYFVTDTNSQTHLEFDVTDCEITELGMFSDGLERLALNFVTGEAHSPFFTALFPYVRSLPEGYSHDLGSEIATFLASARINERTDDDKTLILASRMS